MLTASLHQQQDFAALASLAQLAQPVGQDWTCPRRQHLGTGQHGTACRDLRRQRIDQVARRCADRHRRAGCAIPC